MLEDLVAVGILIIVNYKLLKGFVSDEFSKSLIDSSCIILAIFGVFSNFLTLDSIGRMWASGIMLFIEVLFLVVAVIWDWIAKTRKSLGPDNIKPLHF